MLQLVILLMSLYNSINIFTIIIFFLIFLIMKQNKIVTFVYGSLFNSKISSAPVSIINISPVYYRTLFARRKRSLYLFIFIFLNVRVFSFFLEHQNLHRMADVTLENIFPYFWTHSCSSQLWMYYFVVFTSYLLMSREERFFFKYGIS